jgi:hypothetical protein
MTASTISSEGDQEQQSVPLPLSRQLQAEADASTMCSPIGYEAQFNMLLCPTAAGAGNAALSVVTEQDVMEAVMALDGFGRPSLDTVNVAFTTFQ